MDIPYQSLEKDTLKAILEEFISREGTDYGDHEYSMEQKLAQLYTQLERGHIGISFDPNTETCTLVPLK
ncbi:MAG: YheU family protein [Pseudohongiellaceae bacterium]|nr:YheU family protein [Pseudohongiellaceae bacterium]